MELVRQKNVATYIYVPLVDADGDPVTSAGSLDSKIDQFLDGSAPDGFAACTNEATEIGTSGCYYLLLTSGEMNYDYIMISIESTNAKTQWILINTKLYGQAVAIKSDTAAILIDTDTMEVDLKTYLDAIETNLEGDIEANDTLIDQVITDIAALNNLSSSEVQTVIETNDLDHLLKVAHPSGDPVQNTIMDLVMNKNGSQTFDRSADSLEAIRDRGDDAWTTGGAGGIDAIINVNPEVPNNIDVSNTKLVRLALYIRDLIDDLPTTAEITVGTITIDRSADGGTSWSNVVNAAACSEHAGCIYYDEVFDSGTGYASGDMIRIIFKGQKVTISANDYEIADSTDGMVFIRRLDSGLSGGGPSAGDIADAVWNEPISEHTSSSQFGGKNQKVVPSETLADYKANVSGLAPANEYDSELTAIQADLDSPAQYKANVTGLATESNATTNKNAIITQVNANETKIDIIDGVVDAIKVLTDNLPADTEAVLNRLKALHGEWLRAEQTFTGDDNTKIGMWFYDTEANWNTHNKSTGIIAELELVATFTDGKPTTTKVEVKA